MKKNSSKLEKLIKNIAYLSGEGTSWFSLYQAKKPEALLKNKDKK